MTKHSKESQRKPDTQDASGNVDARRRRMMRAGASSPLLMTIASRPAWAQGGMCSPSALASANASGRHDCERYGISAGWWKNKQGRWPVSPSKSFKTVFGEVMYDGKVLYMGVDNVSLTLGEVIMISGAGEDNPANLGKHLVAAYLNAKEFPFAAGGESYYAYTPEDVKNMYQGLSAHSNNKDNFESAAAYLKRNLELANDFFDEVSPKPTP